MKFLIRFTKWSVRNMCSCVHKVFWLYEFNDTTSSVSTSRMALNFVVSYYIFLCLENVNTRKYEDNINPYEKNKRKILSVNYKLSMSFYLMMW